MIILNNQALPYAHWDGHSALKESHNITIKSIFKITTNTTSANP